MPRCHLSVCRLVSGYSSLSLQPHSEWPFSAQARRSYSTESAESQPDEAHGQANGLKVSTVKTPLIQSKIELGEPSRRTGPATTRSIDATAYRTPYLIVDAAGITGDGSLVGRARGEQLRHTGPHEPKIRPARSVVASDRITPINLISGQISAGRVDVPQHVEPEKQRQQILPKFAKPERVRHSRTDIPRTYNRTYGKRALYRGRVTATKKRPIIRVKTVVTRPHLTPSVDFSSFWNTNFAQIARQYDKQGLDYGRTSAPPTVDPRTADWADELLTNSEEAGPGKIHELSAQFGVSPLNIWRNIALWTVYHEDDLCMKFLRITHFSPYPPVNHVVDLLTYLARRYSSDAVPEATRSQAFRDLILTFFKVSERPIYDGLVIDDGLIRILAPYFTKPQLEDVYRLVAQHNIKVHCNTLLHLTATLTKHGSFEYALAALLDAAASGANVSSVQYRSGCATILRAAMQQPEGMRISLRIVDDLVKLGVVLNTQLCNIIMLNAVEAGDLKTAFSIYHSLVQHSVKADHYTYGILLKGCKGAIDDAETVNATIRAVISGMEVLKNPATATEILHCLALYHSRHHPEQAFRAISEAYLQLFEPEPLLKLGVLSPDMVQQYRPVKQPLQATLPALGIMIGVVLRSIGSKPAAFDDVLRIYRSWRNFVLGADRPLASLAESDHTYNLFLMKFTESRSTLQRAAELVRDMQREFPANLPVKRCPPTAQTFSILLHGFTRHKKMGLAEQVLGHMRKQGIEPVQVTWNTLVAGYAGAQDLDGLLDASRRMDDDGGVWDSWTLGGVRKFRDQSGLRRGLAAQFESNSDNNVVAAPEPDFTEDLNQRLQPRLLSPEGTVFWSPLEGEFADSPNHLVESQ